MSEELTGNIFDGNEGSIQEEIDNLKDIIFKERTRLDKETISFLKRNAKGEKVSKDEQEVHAESFRHLRNIERSYYALIKMLKSNTSGNNKTGMGDSKMFSMQIVKDRPSSMGDIVRIANGE